MTKKELAAELRRMKSANTALLGERDRYANRVITLTQAVEALQVELRQVRRFGSDEMLANYAGALLARDEMAANLRRVLDEIRVFAADEAQVQAAQVQAAHDVRTTGSSPVAQRVLGLVP